MSLLPPSRTNTVSLFRPQESLTCPVNRHTSLVRSLSLPAALSSFLSPRDSHTQTHTSFRTQKHKQTPVKYLTTLLSLHCLCHHLLYCILVCLPACSFSSSVVSAVFPSFSLFSSSVQLFPHNLHQPLVRRYQVYPFLITLLSLVFFSH